MLMGVSDSPRGYSQSTTSALSVLSVFLNPSVEMYKDGALWHDLDLSYRLLFGKTYLEYNEK